LENKSSKPSKAPLTLGTNQTIIKHKLGLLNLAEELGSVSNEFRKVVFETIDQRQKELDTWIEFYSTERTHQGKMCCGRTPSGTLIDGKTVRLEKPPG
jgi:hypothetical protein